jgi:hypothetical protein
MPNSSVMRVFMLASADVLIVVLRYCGLQATAREAFR